MIFYVHDIIGFRMHIVNIIISIMVSITSMVSARTHTQVADPTAGLIQLPTY